jgi:hypothetical protein
MSLFKRAIWVGVGLLVLAAPSRAQAPKAAEFIRRLTRERWVLVPQESSIKLMRRDKGAIHTIIIPDEKVIRLSTIVSDSTLIRVTGLIPGMTRITLVDADRREETLLLIVLPKTK